MVRDPGQRPAAFPDTGRRILPFRRGSPPSWPAKDAPPGDPLAQYERNGEADDYRHRMLVNAAAFLFVMLLIGTGYWLAESMAQLRKDQDCALTGRRGCAPIPYDPGRW